jgi:hypothetical protein
MNFLALPQMGKGCCDMVGNGCCDERENGKKYKKKKKKTNFINFGGTKKIYKNNVEK